MNDLPSAADSTPHPSSLERALPWLALAGFAAWTATLAARTHGVLEADEVWHWLYARHASEHPWNFLHVWARPLPTMLLWTISGLGFDAARMLSVLCAAIAASGAVRAARGVAPRVAACAVPLTFAQPLLFQQTFGVWTEVVFAAVMGAWCIGAVWHRPRLVALAAALLPLIRPEGFFVVALTMGLALLGAWRDASGRTCRWSVLLIAPAGVLAWALAGFVFSGDPLWLPHAWPRNWGSDQAYGHGSVTWLWTALTTVLPLFAIPLVLLGMVGRARRRLLPLTLVTLLILGVHTTLWVLGRFGTAGNPRYFVTLAPAFAVLAAAGIGEIVAWVRPLQRGAARAAIVVVVCVLAVVSIVRNVAAIDVPSMPPDGRILPALARWIETQDQGAVVYSAHPFTYLGTAHVPDDRFRDLGDLRPAVLARIPRGGWLIVEDRFYRGTDVAPDLVRPDLNPPEWQLRDLGFEPVTVPDLGVDMTVTDPRHDRALEHMHLSVYRRAS